MAQERSDADLLAVYAAGGTNAEEAFAAIVAAHGGMVHRTCLRTLGQTTLAEDAAQAVFLVLAQKARQRGTVHGNLGAFLHGVARNVALHARKTEQARMRREQEAARMNANDPGPAAATEDNTLSRIDEAVDRLPRGERAAVIMHYFEGHTQEEVARRLQVPAGTVAWQLKRALERMRGFLSRHGVSLGTTALTSVLAAQTGAASGCPTYLMAAVQKLSAAGLGSSSAAVSGNVTSLAKGAMQMMFWAKVKVAAVVFSGVLILGGGALTATRMAAGEPTAAAPAKPGEFRREKDFAGREWTLTDWKEGERPYKKNLAEREAEYRKKWGEDWASDKGIGTGDSLFSPGVWKWEDVAVIPEGKKATPSQKGGKLRWGKTQALVFAPGGGEEITAIYAVTAFGMYHVDPKTKEVSCAGLMPKYHYASRFPDKLPDDRGLIVYENPQPDANPRDGLDGKAGMWPAHDKYSKWLNVDPITGRVFFAQSADKSDLTLRYVEKLLPYKVGGREMLLPALLDYKEMYKQVGAEPVMVDGKRGKARLAVRTTPVTFRSLPMLIGDWGTKIILSPDGKQTCVGLKSAEDLHMVEIDTGKDLGKVPLQGPVPGGVSMHGGAAGRFDGFFYNLSHPGCGASNVWDYAGRLFRIDLKTGQLQALYDNRIALEAGKDRESKAGEFMHASESYKQTWLDAAQKCSGSQRGFIDGPGDALTLWFTTTCFATQCPRTGAIISGGWDGAGLRRYHDGFVATLASGQQSRLPTSRPIFARPEWDVWVGEFGRLQSNPDVAPDGSLYFADCTDSGSWDKSGAAKAHVKVNAAEDGDILIVRIYRTDWPKEQPVNGYANQFLSPEKREELMLEYCKKHIANYAELSKIY